MTLINPFVPYTDLEPLEYRREPLGEKGGIFFYNTDDEHANKYLRCGGVIYPEAAVSSVEECLVVTKGQLNHNTSRSNTSGSLAIGGLPQATQLSVVSNNTTTTASSISREDRPYAPALTSALKTIVSYVPSLSYFTYTTDTAAKLANCPGHFFYRLGKESPFYSNFTSSKFGAHAIAFHPYFPIVAVAEQRSPFELAIIRFYDVANSAFIDNLVLMHPQMKGVTEIAWKPYSRDVLAVGVYGGVMLWSVHGLMGAMEGHVAAKANGKISLLRGGATNPKRGQRALTGGANGHTFADRRSGAIDGEGAFDDGASSSYLNPQNGYTTNASALLLSTSIGNAYAGGGSASTSSQVVPAKSSSRASEGAAAAQPQLQAVPTSAVRKRPLTELTHILGPTPSVRATAAGFGSVDWSANASSAAVLQQQRRSLRAAGDESLTQLDTTQKHEDSMVAGTASSSSLTAAPTNTFGLGSDSPSAHFVTYSFSSASIPVTTIAFSEVSGALMAVASRGSPDTYLHNISCRPRESLLANLPNYSLGVASNVSFLKFSMDDRWLIRGYEDANRLSVTDISTMTTSHFVTPCPVLKIARMEAVGFNVFALMLKDTEAVTIAHISLGGLTIIANVVTGAHGIGSIGGSVLDVACSSYNLYVRVSSGHILVMAVTGDSNNADEQQHGGRYGDGAWSSTSDGTTSKGKDTNRGDLMFANQQVGIVLKGGIPVPAGNRHIVRMDTFQSFSHGALLAVSDSERNTIRFVPSYFTRGVNAT